MKKLTAILVFLTCAGINNIYAGQSIRDAKILTIISQDGAGTTSTDKVWIVLDKNLEATACHTATLNRVVLDLDKDISKATLSLALTAYTTGTKVSLDTYDVCIDGFTTLRNFYFVE